MTVLRKAALMLTLLNYTLVNRGERRKESFVRHVEREYDITKGVSHRRVVETFALFEVDQVYIYVYVYIYIYI